MIKEYKNLSIAKKVLIVLLSNSIIPIIWLEKINKDNDITFLLREYIKKLIKCKNIKKASYLIYDAFYI